MTVSPASSLGAVLLTLLVAGCGSSSSDPDAGIPIDGPGAVDASVPDAAIADAAPPDATPTVRMLIGLQGGDLVEVNTATAATSIIGTLDIADAFTLSQDPATGILYSVSQDYAGKVDLITIDPCDGSGEVVAPITLSGGTVFYTEGFIINPADSRLYITASLNGGVPGDSSSEAMLTVDLATGVATQVGLFGGASPTDIDGLGFAEGVLYGYDVSGANTDTTPLYSIDPATAVATQIGTPAFPAQPGQLAYDDQTSTMYTGANKPIDGLATYDLVQNTLTPIGEAAGLRSLAIVDVFCE